MSRTARVFVSYRRQDTRHVAGRLADRLVEHFDVFMDMDTIEPGTDFTDVIRQAVENCDIFLSVIGASWTTVVSEQGQRRLDDSADWVVTETAIALQRGVPVIPVLVDGATMPARSELPPDLAALASRQAVTIRHESFTSDVNHLVAAIERRLERTPAAPVAAPDPAPAEDRRAAQLVAWSNQADRAAGEGRWADAVILLENIRSLDANYPDLVRRLSAATARRTEQAGAAETRRRHLSDLYNRAGQAVAAGRVDEAVAALAELVQLDPANTDAARRLDALRQRGGPGFAAPAAMGQPTPFPQPTPAFPATPYGQPTPPPRPPDGPAVAPAYFAPPPPERKRNRAWIIAAIAAVVVALVVVGVLVLPDRTGTVRGITSTPPSTPVFDPPSPTPTPLVTPSPTPGDTTGLSTSELRTHIPGEIRATCDDYAPPTGDPLEVKLVGALRCELSADGSPAKVWYFEYADNAAMDTAYKPYTKGTFKTGDCTAKGQKMNFTTTEQGKKLPGGVLHCYQSEEGETYFAWTHDYLHVLSFAGDPDLSFAKMKKWWESAGPYRQP